MINLCRLLHFQDVVEFDDTGQSPGSFSSLSWRVLVPELAKAADKYQCITAIKYSAEGLLSKLLRHTGTGTSLESTYHFMEAAYLLRNPNHFTLFARHLVLDSGEPFSNLAVGRRGMILPDMVLCKCIGK